MKHTKLFVRGLTLSTLLIVVAFASASTALGQVRDLEPNNICASPQNFGAVNLPLVLTGSLDPTPQTFDIDFFKFTGAPGATVVVDLEGSSTARGTLSDPFLGVFDSACRLILADDDGGVGLNSQLVFTIPSDGIFITAVTSCCDGVFEGTPDAGSYQMTISPFSSVRSISGRVVDAVSGDPLPGNNFPFTRVELRRCTDSQCFEFVNSTSPDASGQYRFERDFAGRLLPVGTYQVFISAELYVPGNTAPFAVGQGEDRSLGDFQLTPLPRAGSITGRLVDANNGQPLPGNTQPFAFVRLLRCTPFGCFSTASSQSTDSMGRFRFERGFSGEPLLAGTYRIEGSANLYQLGQTDPFEVGENEHRDIGDVLLPPFPIRFSEIRACPDLPASGGSCVFSVTLTNGLPTTLNARTWVIVEGFSTGSFLGVTRFQAPDSPIVSLPVGASRPVELRFEVPDSVRNGAVICPQVFVGQASSTRQPLQDKNASFFNTLGQISPFCIVKLGNGFRFMTEQESRPMLRELTEQKLIVDPKKK